MQEGDKFGTRSRGLSLALNDASTERLSSLNRKGSKTRRKRKDFRNKNPRPDPEPQKAITQSFTSAPMAIRAAATERPPRRIPLCPGTATIGPLLAKSSSLLATLSTLLWPSLPSLLLLPL